MSYGGSVPVEDRKLAIGNSRYCLVPNKHMFKIFFRVWVRRKLRDDVQNMKDPCVGRGLMGYLRNKGSISISMSLL
ncbi:hypothetical protein GIB67_032511 [Kingdonia uniflora]|uniref:Uncharacterized protein n=1 Tax=Kingdonia uniflora TaxID=39325 RepID=A0A7J7L7L4_9MAGN|nr:hypothetical protein GIB67_032511 [Kingdonia uniflora]